jgi:uncharacterized membrane protein YeiH
MRYLLDLLGVAVFAVSGVLAAGRKRLDLFGAVVIAVVTAIGGGTLRDILLDRHPIFWIAKPAYLWVILGASIVTLGYLRFWIASQRALLIADALGLGLFTIGGLQVAQQAGHAAVIAVLMGTITGVAGGMTRDLLIGEIPLILRPGRLYATAAIAGATLSVLLEAGGVGAEIAALIGMATIVVLRLVAIRWDLSLPEVRLPDDAR